MSDEREHEGSERGEACDGGGHREAAGEAVDERHVLRVRAGHGANCSSIGSVIDTLFATATIGAAVFAGIVAALRKEEVRVVGHAAGARAADDEARPKEGA